VVFQIALEPLQAVSLPAGRAVARFPIVRRDLAVIVDEALPAAAVIDALRDAAPPHVERIVPFDVYRGAGLPPGRKSLAILVLMQDTARTLTDADSDSAVAKLVEVLAARFGATLR
jgi:phenylalanyl-tRNA synthetase beta chain